MPDTQDFGADDAQPPADPPVTDDCASTEPEQLALFGPGDIHT